MTDPKPPRPKPRPGPIVPPRPYAYCVRCGYMFIKTPPLPAISCRCGAMEEADR